MGLVSGMGCKADGDMEQGERWRCALLGSRFPPWGGFYSKRKGQGGEGGK